MRSNNHSRAGRGAAGKNIVILSGASPCKARDTVRVLSDFDETGHARKITVCADGLNIPSGVQPLPRGSKAVAAVYDRRASPADQPPTVTDRRYSAPKGDSAIVYSIPNIYLMTDWDGDGRADTREVLYGTAGFLDTHGGMSSFLYWIDGWIYGTHGFRNHSELRDKTGRVTVLDSGSTYRFRPDGSAFEIYTHGQTNPFGLTVDPLGNFYSTDSHSRPVSMLLRRAYYEGIGKQHDGLGFAPRITDDDHGFTPRAIRQPDFLTCDDPWFRPVQAQHGPDGALYIAGFYNPIIGHYEFPLADPRRDHTHGRIWRIVWRGESAGASANADTSKNDHASAAGNADAPGNATALGNGNATENAGVLGRVGVPPAAPGILPGASNVQNAPPSQTTPPQRAGVPGRMPATAGRMPTLPMPDLTALHAAGLVQKLADPNLIVRTLATNELVDRVGKGGVETLAKTVTALDEAEFLKIIEHDTFDSVPKLHWDASSLSRSHALWALSRIAPLPHRILVTSGMDMTDESYARINWFAIVAQDERLNAKAMAGPRQIIGNLAASLNAEKRTSPHFDSINARVDADLLGRLPSAESVKPLIGLLTRTSGDDIELIHTARMALRDCLVSTGGYAAAEKFLASNPEYADKVADVSLGAKTPEAAEFLLGHLGRTKLQGARSGEFLRHAVLSLPPEKLGAIAGLIENIKDAPLPQRLSVADNLAQAYRQRGLPLPDAITA